MSHILGGVSFLNPYFFNVQWMQYFDYTWTCIYKRWSYTCITIILIELSYLSIDTVFIPVLQPRWILFQVEDNNDRRTPPSHSRILRYKFIWCFKKLQCIVVSQKQFYPFKTYELIYLSIFHAKMLMPLNSNYDGNIVCFKY